MNNLSDYYNSLFSIEFTVLSIVLAAVFLLLQMIHENRLYKFVRGFSRIRLFVVTLIVGFSLLVSAIGLLLTSLTTYDFIPEYDFHTRYYLNSPPFALCSLVLFLFSVVLTIYVPIKEIVSLRPEGLIKKLTCKVKAKTMRIYLIAKYGLTEPHLIKINFAFESEGGPSQTNVDEEERKYERDLILFHNLIKDKGDGNDPYEPIGEMAIRAIRDRDKSLLERALSSFHSILRKDVYIARENNSNWDPNDQLVIHLVEYSIQWMSFLLEECVKEGSSRLLGTVYEFTKNIGRFVLEKREIRALQKIVGWWKLEADKALSADTRSFIQLVQLQKDLCKTVFEDLDSGMNKETADEIFRSLGWLGERLIERKGIENRPLMYDTSYESAYDALFYALVSHEWDYANKYPNKYPLIFFDAIMVVFRALSIELGKDKDGAVRSRISENVFDCMYTYSSFAVAAVNNGSGEGASLATLRLVEAYERLQEIPYNQSIDRSIKQAIGLMVNVAFASAGKPTSSASSAFLNIESKLFSLLQTLPNSHASTLSAEIKDHYIRTDLNSNKDAVWEFIKRLGGIRGTNFGLNFNSFAE